MIFYWEGESIRGPIQPEDAQKIPLCSEICIWISKKIYPTKIETCPKVTPVKKILIFSDSISTLFPWKPIDFGQIKKTEQSNAVFSKLPSSGFSVRFFLLDRRNISDVQVPNSRNLPFTVFMNFLIFSDWEECFAPLLLPAEFIKVYKDVAKNSQVGN